MGRDDLIERLENPGNLHSGWREAMREAAAALKAAEERIQTLDAINRQGWRSAGHAGEQRDELRADLTAARAELAMAVPAIATLKRVRSELEIEIERLREGLRPFAQAAAALNIHDPDLPDNVAVLRPMIGEYMRSEAMVEVKVSDLRHCFKLLSARALGEQGK